MGQGAQTPSVKLVLTKNDAGRLNETLTKLREQLAGVNDDVGRGQRDFLEMTLASLQSAMRAAGITPGA